MIVDYLEVKADVYAQRAIGKVDSDCRFVVMMYGFFSMSLVIAGAVGFDGVAMVVFIVAGLILLFGLGLGCLVGLAKLHIRSVARHVLSEEHARLVIGSPLDDYSCV